MLKKCHSILIIVSMAVLSLPVMGQSPSSPSALRYLRGKVYHATTGRVLPGVSVKVSGGHSTVSDREGYFALDLSVGDKGSAGTVLTIYMMDARLGNDMAEVVVPSSADRDIRLEFRSDRYQVVSGTVVDRATQALLEGISVQVTPDVQGLASQPPSPVVSDQMGNFWIALDKEAFGEVSHVRLNAHDASGLHKDWSGWEQARTGIVVSLESTASMPEKGNVVPDVKPAATKGTLCVRNLSPTLKDVHVHKCGAGDNCYLCEAGATVSGQLEPNEEQCYEEIPVGRYLVMDAEPYQATVKYTAQINAGKVTRVSLR